jgi:ribulose 1,5-bisphosphate synthetase/thiazole synthase
MVQTQPQSAPERIIKTDLTQFSRRRRDDGPYADNLDVDVLIVGAGFSGMYLLYEMRKQGYNTVLYDAGLGFGGTWYVLFLNIVSKHHFCGK